MVESLNAAELSALSTFDIARALNEIIEETSHCIRVKHDVLQKLAIAKVDALRATGEDLLDAKERRLMAELQLQYCKDRAAMLKQNGSFLQTLLNAARIV